MDILERLQAVELGDEVLFDAAAEIERLTNERDFAIGVQQAIIRRAEIAEEARLKCARAAIVAEAEIERLRAALKGIAEFCSGDDGTLSAIGRISSIRNTADHALGNMRGRRQNEGAR